MISLFVRRLTLAALLALTLTPIGVRALDEAVTDPQGAHAAVLADGAPFADWRMLESGLIGLAQYWEATPVPGAPGDWAVVYTYGWGDCQAGCIDRHTWSFVVTASGEVSYIGESGPELPAEAPAALRAYPDLLPTPSPTASPNEPNEPVTSADDRLAMQLVLLVAVAAPILAAVVTVLIRRRSRP